MTLRICTYNIHKGLSQFNRRMTIHKLREQLHALNADLVFLQEVQGMHLLNAQKFPQWPQIPQHEFLAKDFWHDAAYGRNAIYDHGHHGNAILSRFEIVSSENLDVSAHRFEQRGLLHCKMLIPGIPDTVHCVCVHLGLTKAGRKRQLHALVNQIDMFTTPGTPLIIAGDFNEWRHGPIRQLAQNLNLTEAIAPQKKHSTRSFPSNLPILALDHIFVRGFTVENIHALSGTPWSGISDHAPLLATLQPSHDIC